MPAPCDLVARVSRVGIAFGHRVYVALRGRLVPAQRSIYLNVHDFRAASCSVTARVL